MCLLGEEETTRGGERVNRKVKIFFGRARSYQDEGSRACVEKV